MIELQLHTLNLNILKLKDGDILFFDELPNGNINTLNACLTFIESRITAAGRKLPNIMIVGAGNYQGIRPNDTTN